MDAYLHCKHLNIDVSSRHLIFAHVFKVILAGKLAVSLMRGMGQLNCSEAVQQGRDNNSSRERKEDGGLAGKRAAEGATTTIEAAAAAVPRRRARGLHAKVIGCFLFFEAA